MRRTMPPPLSLLSPLLLALVLLAACGQNTATSAPSPGAGRAVVGIGATTTATARASRATRTPTRVAATPTTADTSPPPSSTSAPPAPPTLPPTPQNVTLPPGSPLPSDAGCAASIARSAWEPRPANATANARNLYAEGVRAATSYTDPAQSYLFRVTGNFSGTTDEIIQWAACKWGFAVDTVRAQAVVESYWRQSTLGDCGARTQPQTNGCASVGLLQVKGADIPATHPNTWPYAWESTAWNVDYALSVRRACYDGKITWLHYNNPSYGPGDLWGCIGEWFSGDWHDSGAEQYIATVQQTLAAREWEHLGP
jgi:hypothetical protein